ncbi:MAG: hypothetical protein ACE5DI_04315 [Candidatus Micrarchaeia archaeon]
MSRLVCDASSLISLSSTCNIEVLKFLKGKNARFLIPPAVHSEIVSRPIQIRKYQFSAVRLRNALTTKSLEVTSVEKLKLKTQEVMNTANNSFFVEERPLRLVHDGEAECVALYDFVNANALLIDEKTTRMMIEDPLRLQKVLQSEYKASVDVNSKNLSAFSKITKNMFVTRSSEILAAAAKKGFFSEYKDPSLALRAAVYALKESGCSLTNKELKGFESVKV